jgi:hypothetical protein
MVIFHRFLVTVYQRVSFGVWFNPSHFWLLGEAPPAASLCIAWPKNAATACCGTVGTCFFLDFQKERMKSNCCFGL